MENAIQIPKGVLRKFRRGMVIPAMPLALKRDRTFDENHQRGLLRYYIDAGAGGVAVGVHSTQFEIREPGVGLFRPVLSFAADAISEHEKATGRQIMRIAGVCGRTRQAVQEAEFARSQGYHAVLLGLAAFRGAKLGAMISHCRRIAEIMPVIGFYLQPAAGGFILPVEFWREFARIDNVIGIKMAPFNRYQTLDVVRAVCEAGREREITLYTGNDDNIVVDLLTEYRIRTEQGTKRVRIKGGLLGHWCVWTRKAVELLDEIHSVRERDGGIPASLLTRAVEVTDTNAAFFDVKNNFAGCIPGIHEVLRRQGLLAGIWCLDSQARLSPGQKAEIDRVCAAYPHLNDNAFVAQNLERWLS